MIAEGDLLMENGTIVIEKEITKASVTNMAVAEDASCCEVGAQLDVIQEFLHEVASTKSFEQVEEEHNTQDPCIEKLELKDQEQLSSMVKDIGKTGKHVERLERKSSSSKLNPAQKLGAKAAAASQIKSGASSFKVGVTLKKKASADIGSGKSLHSIKGSVNSDSALLARTNGVANENTESVRLSEVQVISSEGSLPRQTHVRKSPSNFTVPQPFALATDKRASVGGQSHSVGRSYMPSRSFNSQIIRGVKKANNTKGDDSKSQDGAKVEENKAHLRASANTFNFNSDVRAARRKEFNSKMEERLTAKEAEKTQAQAKTKENMQAEIKKFRKSLTFKATPMPSFYHDATPPKLEFKKIPPTRAKSPKLGRRNSNTGAHTSQSQFNAVKENNGQSKVLKPDSQLSDSNKTSKRPLKQATGPNSSTQRSKHDALENESSSNAENMSANGVDIEGFENVTLKLSHEESATKEAPSNGEGQENVPGELIQG